LPAPPLPPTRNRRLFGNNQGIGFIIKQPVRGSQLSALVRFSAISSNMSTRRIASAIVSSCKIAPHKEQFLCPSGIAVSADISHHRLLCSLIGYHLPLIRIVLESKPCLAFLIAFQSRKVNAQIVSGVPLKGGETSCAEETSGFLADISSSETPVYMPPCYQIDIIPLVVPCPERQGDIRECF
jgi:hypothetical protein